MRCYWPARADWREYQPSPSDTATATTKRLEAKHRNEQENERKLIADVQALEIKLGLACRWKEGSEEWETAKKLVREREYRKALDKLEGLLVTRIFEMTRLNVAGTSALFHISIILTDFLYRVQDA